jgi:hypothetical protein
MDEWMNGGCAPDGLIEEDPSPFITHIQRRHGLLAAVVLIAGGLELAPVLALVQSLRHHAHQSIALVQRKRAGLIPRRRWHVSVDRFGV